MIDQQNNDPRFLNLLRDFDRDALEIDDATIFGLWSDLTLAYTNPGWKRFSAMNGGEPTITSEWALGRCVLDAIAEPLRPFYAANYRKSLMEGRPWEHVYECSSADQFRLMHMMVLPLGAAEGLLVINSLRQEIAHSRTPLPPLDELYRNAHGIVTQCSHCRRVRRDGTEHVWDWVPAWVVAQPARTSHGLCEPCIGFHHPLQPRNVRGPTDSFKTDS